MESQEFNLSVLDNVATSSTPLKDCLEYEAVLCLIKEEIDVSQTEDEGDYQIRSNNASRPRARQRDSESRGSDGKFKPPYGLNHSARSKSPGTALISRTKHRSDNYSKNGPRKSTARRARSLGRVMPGRSCKLANGHQRSSISYSDTSGYSEPTENGATSKTQRWTPRKFLDCSIKDEYETESEAVAELLTMAQEQASVTESPGGRNSTVSSQGESTSLATSDPLDTGPMEADCYEESSQQAPVSVFRRKLFDQRSICDMPKNAETIKRNLHFSDGQETDEENHNYSLILSPERVSLLNGNVDRNSTPSVGRTRKQSHDSIASTLNSRTSDSCHFSSQKEASTTPLCPALGNASQCDIARGFNSSTPNSYNFQRQRDASQIPQQSSMSKTSRESTPAAQNSSYDVHDLKNKRKKSTVPQSCSAKKTSQSSTSSTASTLNLTYDLENSEPNREPSTTPEVFTRKPRRGSASSTASTLNLIPDLHDLELKREASTTPQHSNTSEASAASIPKNLPQESQDLDPEEAGSTAVQPSSVNKTFQDSTLEKVVQNQQDLDPEREARMTLQPPNMSDRCEDSISTQENPAQDLKKIDPEKDSSTTLPRPRKRKSSRTNLTCEMQNLDPEREMNAAPLRPEKSTKTNQGNKPNLCDSREQTEASPTPQSPSMKKPCQESIVSIRESLTQYLENLNFKKELSATPPHPRHRRISQNSTANAQTSCIQDLPDFDSIQEAKSTSPRPKKRKTIQASTVGPAKSPTRDSSNVDSAKNNQRESSPTEQPSTKKESIQDSTVSIRDSLTQYREDLDFEKELNAPLADLSQNSTPESQKSCITELNHPDTAQEATSTSPRPRKRKTNQASIVSSAKRPAGDPINENTAKEASVTPPHPRKKRKKEFEIPGALEGSTQDRSIVDFAKDTSLLLPRPIKRKESKTKMESSPKIVTQNVTDLVVKKKPNATLQRLRNKKSTSASPLKGLSQELEKCIGNADFERLYEEMENGMESPSFTFETVQMLDDYECNPEANKILSKILASPKSETGEKASRSIEHLNSSEDPLDYDPLYITEAEDNEVATTSSSKRKGKMGTENIKNKRKNFTVDKSFKENNEFIDKNDTLEEGSSVDPLDYDPLHVAELEDNAVANPSTSKGKEKTAIDKIKKKRKSLNVDEPFKKSRSIDKDDSLEAGSRRSSRSRKKRQTLSISDWEEAADLSDEAAKLIEKVEAAKRKELLSPSTLDKLDDMVVQLRHEVLPQHDIETRAGTMPLTYEQQMRFLDFASLNKDLYSSAEDKIIKRNWKAFCEDHDWDPKNYGVFLQFKHGDKLIMSCMEERRKFVQFLADGLPNRPLYSVYNRFKKIYSEYAATGEWYSPKEDKKILAYMLHDSGKQPEMKFAELAKVLNRSRFSIWKRYQNLKEKQSGLLAPKRVLTKVEWRLPVVTEFITKLLDVTMSEDLMELKDAFIPAVVWKRLEQKIEIDYNFMKRSWEQQFHLQFFSPEPLSANATKIRLIEYMWMKGIREGREIEWHVVVKYFDGCTISFLRKMFNHMTAEASMALQSRDLSDIMKWLYEEKIERLKRSKTDHYLSRLRYVDGRVEIVPEDMTHITLTSKRMSLD